MDIELGWSSGQKTRGFECGFQIIPELSCWQCKFDDSRIGGSDGVLPPRVQRPGDPSCRHFPGPPTGESSFSPHIHSIWGGTISLKYPFSYYTTIFIGQQSVRIAPWNYLRENDDLSREPCPTFHLSFLCCNMQHLGPEVLMGMRTGSHTRQGEDGGYLVVV